MAPVRIPKEKIKTSHLLMYILGLLGFATITSFLCVAIVARSLDKFVSALPVTLFVDFIVFGILLIVFVYQTVIVKDSYKSFSKLREYLIINITIMLSSIFSSAMYIFVSPYAVPIAIAPLLISILISQRIGILSSIASFLIALITCPLPLFLFERFITIGQIAGLFIGFMSSVCMTFLVHRGYTRFKITCGALLIGLLTVPFSIPLGIVEMSSTPVLVLKTCCFSFLGSAIAVGYVSVVLPVYERIFRVWTDFKLAEVCSLNQPLLRELKEKAPGTFSHSLTVASLAENCAIAIGLNPFMARACAMYHDIGKSKNAEYFVENQQGGYNPHDDLIIDVSVKIIIEHPKEGAKILKEHKLPDTVIKAALEHHGDSTLMFFYLKAKGITEGDLEADKYRYPDPRPSTKYSAIIMICDMCEAMIRSKKPSSYEELENMVYKIIEGRIIDGQLSECEISILELQKIKTSICQAMPSMLHERIDYDKAKERR